MGGNDTPGIEKLFPWSARAHQTGVLRQTSIMPSRQPLAVSEANGASFAGAGRPASAASKLVLGLAMGGGFSALVLLLTLLWIVYQRLKASRTNPYDPSAVKQLRRYSYRQLKAATGSFSEAHRLGQGGFGTVYHGVLRSGQSVAVKKLDASSLQGEREFQNEVSLIGCVHSPHIVTLLGFCVEGKRRLLVYDFMANRSLQEALFDDEYPITLRWDTRFKIILDTAQGLAFLHFQRDPPIIHGDVKPSNILLDANLSARIADFGLARLKVETPAPDPGNAELEREALERERIRFERAAREKVRRQRKREEADRKKAAAAAIASEHRANAPGDAAERTVSPKGTLVSDHQKPPPQDSFCDDTRTEVDTETVDLSTEDGKGEEERRGYYLRPGGAKSEEVPSSGELSIGDYILEWRTNDSARRARSNGKDSSWRDDSSFEFNSREFTQNDCMKKKGRSRSSDGWVDLSGELIQEPLKRKEVGRREGREWWKDEHLADSKSKAVKKEKGKGKARKHRREWWKDEYSGQLRSTKSKEWWNREDFSAEYSGKHRELADTKLKKCRDNGGTSKDLGWRDDYTGDLSQIADSRSSRRERTRSKDWLSGEVASRGVSSTPSMRGTICYVAPEYGGGGLLSEKSDVYSFGVLMLVIISGRRPLQVMASPIAELERANLISWARQLAQAGNVLDLVDVNFQGQFSKEQATLCIMVALLCLQRIPAMRPAMTDVVKILLGQAELPTLPFEYSPSPPGVQLASTPRLAEADLPLLS